ncbi:Protein of unknown function [Cotesia congregata]|uniref:Uncharacterized protein n=1 Tax=Cotesia congregata TaxID=51543 RepID=A0A8J2MJX4_COTCN|nr:Protein of unknown function [Cotesia congregata]
MELIIDIQGLTNDQGTFVPKEIAIIGVDSSIQKHWLLKPSFSDSQLLSKTRQTNYWLTKNKHGIRWSDGGVTLSDIFDIFKFYCEKAHTIYVRGSIKLKYLETLLRREIINLEEEDPDECPSFKNLESGDVNCGFHGTVSSKVPCKMCYSKCEETVLQEESGILPVIEVTIEDLEAFRTLWPQDPLFRILPPRLNEETIVWLSLCTRLVRQGQTYLEFFMSLSRSVFDSAMRSAPDAVREALVPLWHARYDDGDNNSDARRDDPNDDGDSSTGKGAHTQISC